MRDDAPPVSTEHSLHVPAAEPYAGHHVRVPHALPIRIGEIEERLGFECAEAVHEDVHVGKTIRDGFDPLRRGEIARCAAQLCIRVVFRDTRDGLIDSRLRAPVDDDGRALTGEGPRDSQADAERRAADKRGFPSELQIHVEPRAGLRAKCGRTALAAQRASRAFGCRGALTRREPACPSRCWRVVSNNTSSRATMRTRVVALTTFGRRGAEGMETIPE